MQSYASHLLLSLLKWCSCLLCLLFLCRSHLVLKLFHCVSLSTILGFCCLFYTAHIFAVPAGIAYLAFSTDDWSQLHAGKICLASLVYDWVTACWDSLPILLNACVVCLAFFSHDWTITNDCFNPFGVSSCYGIAQKETREMEKRGRRKTKVRTGGGENARL